MSEQQPELTNKPAETKPAAKPTKTVAPKAQPLENDVRKLDLRVGLIVSCKNHPDADSLYVEEIDVGEETPRTVVSGLAKHIPLEKMINQRLIVVCNMKPAALRGVKSHAMVICAKSEDGSVVEFVEPPADAKLGERISFEGYNTAQDPAPPILNPKKKEFESIKPFLKTNADLIAVYKDTPFMTSAGPCKSQTLPNASLS